jgi:Lrp/AsnC family transcriptional regulator, leucine-responsive regulatory protein
LAISIGDLLPLAGRPALSKCIARALLFALEFGQLDAIPARDRMSMRNSDPQSAVGLDGIDRAILRILQRDNRMSQRAIAEAVNLSPAAVQRRIKRLETSGVIAANIAVLDPAAIGRPLTLIVEVEMENEKQQALDAARRAFAADENVQQCYYVTGEADFILVIAAASMADYEALTRRLFFENNNVKRFRTFVAMNRVKVGLSQPIA